MDMLATGHLGALSFAIVLATALSACSAPKSDHPSAAPAAPANSVSGLGQGTSTAGLSSGPDSVAAVEVASPADANASESDRPSIASLPSNEADADIGRFVPKDATIRMQKRGDLDGDGRADVLLVLQRNAQSESTPRSLTILRGAADGSLEKVIDNPRAILCQSCGGMMGDPLSDVTIGPGGFVIAFEGGSRELWSRQYTFAYSRDDDDWHLDRIDEKVSDRVSGHQQEKRMTREQIGSVSIKDFDAALMAQESEQ
jgi:hypothetical protein